MNANTKRRLLFIGNSLTEGLNIENLFVDFEIINKGIHGDTTSGVYSRLDTDVIQLKPDIVFLLIGINDLAMEKSDDEIVSMINKIIEKLLNALPICRIYLTSLLPTRDIEARSNERIININNKLEELAREWEIDYFDLHSTMVGIDGQLCRIYTTDGLHLSSAGYNAWITSLKKILTVKEESVN